MNDEKLRADLGNILGKAEVLIYCVMGVLLFIAALAAAASAGGILWSDIRNRTLASGTLGALDQLLLVLMLVELLHTVSISIRSHVLVTEPFLIVGLIASIRRILVITLHAASMTHEGELTAENAALFRESMYELALLGVLILIFVISITMLRRSENKPAESRIT
jgi:uncharacterized membrane protein (DUF373 family)